MRFENPDDLPFAESYLSRRAPDLFSPALLRSFFIFEVQSPSSTVKSLTDQSLKRQKTVKTLKTNSNELILLGEDAVAAWRLAAFCLV